MTKPMPPSAPPPSGPLIQDGVGILCEGLGLLLLGRSGSGRSDLALRLIDGGALLIADEQVAIDRRGDRLYLAPPPFLGPALRGRIEARGIGLLAVPFLEAPQPLDWVIELRAPADIERLAAPPPCRFLGLDVPTLLIAPFEASATAKLRLALRSGPRSIIGRDD